MSAKELAIMFKDILEEYRILEDSPLNSIRFVRTFEESGILLFNPGIVVTLDTGEEFQISVIKSK